MSFTDMTFTDVLTILLMVLAIAVAAQWSRAGISGSTKRYAVAALSLELAALWALAFWRIFVQDSLRPLVVLILTIIATIAMLVIARLCYNNGAQNMAEARRQMILRELDRDDN